MKILLTHDGSEMADVAVPRVAALSQAYGPETTVVALCITPTHSGTGSAEWADASSSLDRIRRSLEDHGLARVSTTVAPGAPGPLIVETAEQLQCDLIVMSTSGHSGHKQFLGSVADYVVRNSRRTPVMLCRPEPAGREPFKRFLLPLDGSDENAGAVALALRLAPLHDARIVLLRLTDTIEQLRSMRTPAGYILSSDIAPRQALEQIIAAEHESAKRELDADMRQLHAAGLTDAAVVVTPGTPGQTIVDTAEQLGCDLIVMSSSGRGRREGAQVLGSVADHVLQHVAHAVVLLVPPEADGSRRVVLEI